MITIDIQYKEKHMMIQAEERQGFSFNWVHEMRENEYEEQEIDLRITKGMLKNTDEIEISVKKKRNKYEMVM